MSVCTEEEAKTKWCPFSHVVTSTTWVIKWYSETGDPIHDRSARCIGSACMAWRWSGDNGWDSTRAQSKGGCGLAGKPLL